MGLPAKKLLDLAKVILFVSALSVFIKICNVAYLATQFPLELEARESTVWLHVLAMKAGVNLYDHSKVDFVNMNHGPLDPILKYLVSSIFPWLSGAAVTRFFVALLPLSMFVFCLPTAYGGLGGLSVPLLLSAAMYVTLSLSSFFPLVGRSDPTALVFYLGLAGVTSSQSLKKTPIYWLTVGFLSGIVYLINWRYAIFGCSLCLLPLYRETLQNGLMSALGKTPILLMGFIAPIVAILLLVFNGNFHLYWEHFFGFFGINKNLPPGHAPSFKDVLHAISEAKVSLHLLILVFLTTATYLSSCLYKHTSKKKVTRDLSMAALFLAGTILFSTLAFYLNYMGGGPYYLAPCFVVVWMFLARSFPGGLLLNSALGIFVALAVFSTFDITSFLERAQWLKDNQQNAKEFDGQLKRLNQSAGVYTEELYLFESSYHDEKIDMGDSIYGGVYDETFDRTASEYFESLKKKTPRYVYAGICESSTLKTLLKEKYKVVADPGYVFPANQWGPKLFEMTSLH